jgi:hypothetical protein
MLFNGGIAREARMSRRDFNLIAATAVISSFIAWFAGASLSTSPEAPDLENRAASGEHATFTIRPADQGARVMPGQPEPDSAVQLQRDTSRPEDGGRPDDGKAADMARAVQLQKKFGEQFSRFIEDGGTRDPGAINARVENRFYSEEWNRDWAVSREGSIRTLFVASDELSGIDPLQITCRSRNCQVVLSVSSRDQAQQLAAKVMKAATRSDVGMKDKVVSYFPDVSTGRLLVYLSENGNTDLFQ